MMNYMYTTVSFFILDDNYCCFLSHTTSTTASHRILLLIYFGLSFGCLTNSYGLAALVNFSIGSAIYTLHSRYRSASTILPSIITLFKRIIILHLLFNSLLSNAIISEVVELFESICVLTFFHLLVYFCD